MVLGKRLQCLKCHLNWNDKQGIKMVRNINMYHLLLSRIYFPLVYQSRLQAIDYTRATNAQVAAIPMTSLYATSKSITDQ